MRVARTKKVRRVVIVGGVAANSRLREKFQAQAEKHEVHFPSLALCTDNAAMIAAAAHFHHSYQPNPQGKELTLSPHPGLKLA
ncbi:MAG: hypothetical protein A2Z21_03120 [Candidatus Fraserbacteria bacterium RBG_16_55_9]|uniref:Gcp-like domain-containing protein n=1 Tax=Fraserbacteria sp. (strain RBG_16_55_9) TaxID=1817864 RepID=A0A1F5UVP4_FRAXR|nr:MAG: hypothetical protein A2Z21_03120 [Candidatus Fraserbacteria bacterium RBG_16_55_9]